MDPQTTITYLFEALADGNEILFTDCFAALAEWFSRGGFAPRLTADIMGETQQRTIDGWRTVPREYLSCRPFHLPYAIMTVTPGNLNDGYKFVIYSGENTKAEYHFAK